MSVSESNQSNGSCNSHLLCLFWYWSNTRWKHFLCWCLNSYFLDFNSAAPWKRVFFFLILLMLWFLLCLSRQCKQCNLVSMCYQTCIPESGCCIQGYEVLTLWYKNSSVQTAINVQASCEYTQVKMSIESNVNLKWSQFLKGGDRYHHAPLQYDSVHVGNLEGPWITRSRAVIYKNIHFPFSIVRK